MTETMTKRPAFAFPQLAAQPGAILGSVAALQVLLWTALPPLVSAAPPLDVTEGYLWGREWPLLTYKHPQLPAWLLETGYRLTGSFVWPHYLISQLFIVAAFALVYRFGRDVMGARAGLAGALLMTALYYCEWVSQQFNHDVAQIPFWAAIILLLWRAGCDDRWRDWLLLGAVAGVGLYAKFSTGVIIGFGGLWLLADPRARGRLAGIKPWLALALFLIIASPLAIALLADDFLPFRYAAERADWVTGHRAPLYFISVQLTGHMMLAVVTVAIGLLPLRRGRVVPPGQEITVEARAFRYVLWMGLGPGLMISVASLFVGVGEAWATPMFDLSGLIAVMLLRRSFNDAVLRRIAIAAPLLIVVWVTAYCGQLLYVSATARRLAPPLIPTAAMGERFDALWRGATGKPLRIIGGMEDPILMAAALAEPGEPSFFTDFNTEQAPWVTPERIRRDGMLVLWVAKDSPPDQAAPYIAAATRKGEERFIWSTARSASPVTLGYAILPPQE